MATTNDLLLNLNHLSGQQLGVLRTLTPLVGQIVGQVKGLKGGTGGNGPGAPKKAGPGVFAQLKGGFTKAHAVLAGVSAAGSAVVAALEAVPNAVLKVISVSSAFVKALNPYLVEQYEREQQNLRATIGFALVPVIKYATKSLRDWAGILLPSVQMLRPAVERITAAVSGALLGAVRTLARLMEGFAKVLEPLVGTIESNWESWGALFETVAAVVDVIVQFGGAIQIWIAYSKSASEGLRRLVTAIALVATRLLGAFGGADAIKRFRESLESAIASRTSPARGLLAAPNDAGVGGIEEIAKKMSERAFVATAGTGEIKASETELLGDILKKVQAIEQEPLKGLKDIIRDALREAVRDQISQTPAAQAVNLVRDTSANLYADAKGRFDRFTADPRGSIESLLGGGN